MPTINRVVYIPEDLFHEIEEYARVTKKRSINSAIIELIERGLRTRGSLLLEEESPVDSSKMPTEIEPPEAQENAPPKSADAAKSKAPEVTQQAKEEPTEEDIETETSELAKPELPKGEVPLAGVPSSGKPKEPSTDFSWATRRGNLKDLVVRWIDVFRKWDIKQLEDTFKRCKGDDPTREAVIIVMKERFVKTLPETEKAMIRKFFKDEEVQNFMKEHGIKGIEEPAPEEKPEESQEVKANA